MTDDDRSREIDDVVEAVVEELKEFPRTFPELREKDVIPDRKTGMAVRKRLLKLGVIDECGKRPHEGPGRSRKVYGLRRSEWRKARQRGDL